MITNHKKHWQALIGVMILCVLWMALSGCVLNTAPKTSSTKPTEASGEPGATKAAADTQAPDTSSTDEPAAQVTYTPTVAFIATIVVEELQVHTGPGYEYPVLTTIGEAIEVRVIGVNAQKTWFFILLPDNRQGWIPIESANYEFDLDLLPVVKETPLAPTPYGNTLLVPPQLSGITPSSPSNPARGMLSIFSIILLTILTSGVSILLSRRARARRPSLGWLIQTLLTLF